VYSVCRAVSDALPAAHRALLGHLPFTFEWNAVAWALLAYAVVHGGLAWLGALPLGLTLAACLAAALRARVDSRGAGIRGRTLIANVDRTSGRLLRCPRAVSVVGARSVPGGAGETGLGAAGAAGVPGGARAFSVSFWTENGLERRRSSTASGPRWPPASTSPWWTRAGARGTSCAGRPLVAGRVTGGHRVSRRRPAGLRVKTMLRASLVTRMGLAVALLAAVLGAELRQPALFAMERSGPWVAAAVFAREALNLGRCSTARSRPSGSGSGSTTRRR